MSKKVQKGEVYGYWHVGEESTKGRHWCHCGKCMSTWREVLDKNLISGRSLSCGCNRKKHII